MMDRRTKCNLCGADALEHQPDNEGDTGYIVAMPLTEIQKERDELNADNERLREALHELVTLKDIKETTGKTEEYLDRQPKAWQKARDALRGE